MVVGKKFLFIKHFVGKPKPDDFYMVPFVVPNVKDGEIMVQAEYISVDPYMRLYNAVLPLGITMVGAQVGIIVESKNPHFPVGRRIYGNFGWTTHTVVNPTELTKDLLTLNTNLPPYILPDFGNLPVSLALGMLGMPGNAALFGFMEICQPKVGETAVITGAAGAVGSHVGQIAKMMGLTVIGIAGSDEKCRWIVDELGFDYAINYKTDDVAAALKLVAPQGIDCYFDNVGGELSSIVISQMYNFGRISVCGSISSYNDDSTGIPKATILQPSIVIKQLKIEGFIVTRWWDKWMEGIAKNLIWLREKKLKYRETVTVGFENMFEAFIGLLEGTNIGKAIVKV